MKIKQLLLICITCFIASLFSCQKDFTAPNNSSARPDSAIVVSGDSNYLDKILIAEDTLGGFDSTFLIFNYDVLKRLKSVSSQSVSNPIDSGVFLNFLYNSNDTLPFKIIEGDSLPIVTDYFCYYNNGKLIKDSTYDYSNPITPYYHVSNYTYNSTNSIINNGWNIWYINQTPTISYRRDTFLLDSRANIVSSRFYSSNNATQNYFYVETVNRNYDNMKNPFLKVNSYNIYNFISTRNSPINNILSENNSSMIMSNNYNSNFTNSYYSNGFLKKQIRTSTNVPNASFTYFYKSL